MKWPWSKTHDACEGAEAHREATAHLAANQASWPEVKRVSQSLRELRERNHFRQQLENIFDGGENRER